MLHEETFNLKRTSLSIDDNLKQWNTLVQNKFHMEVPGVEPGS